MQPIAAILTDFGSDDWFVASMKGKILQRCPSAQIVDITHNIQPGNIHATSYVLASTYQNFPQGTVFLIVVDPGVGSTREPMAAKVGNHYFVLPNNGLLSHVLQKEPETPTSFRNIETIIEGDSHTFHGRDIFAPAVGQLLQDPDSFSSIGKLIESLARLQLAGIRNDRNVIHGVIEYIDHYGNAISNLPKSAIESLSIQGETTVKWGDMTIPLVKTFSEVAKGKPLAYIGSNNTLEIAINLDNAQKLLNIQVGDTISIQLVTE